MRNPFASCVGGILSADIAVPEHDRELTFYAQILTTGTAPLWREDLSSNLGTPVIGLGARIPEYDHLPLQWMPHIQVKDVAASADRAVKLGGSELMHGRTKEGVSQWAVLRDPDGAAFGIIPVVDTDPDAPDQPHGRISWLSLVTPDVGRTCRFYEQVVGWSRPESSVDGAFEMLLPDGVAAAEIGPAGNHSADLPPAWIISLPVGDLAESLRRVREGGGQIIQGSSEAGRAVIRDPVGVFIALQHG